MRCKAGLFSRAANLLLPTLSGTLVGVYSTRKAVSGYTGYLFKLARSSDSATLDVPADYSGVAAWIGSDTVYVTDWYDQSGHTSDLAATGDVPFTLAGDNDTLRNPFVEVDGSNYLTGTTDSLNGETSAVLSAVVAPVGTQDGGGNNVDNAVIFYAETGGWGTVALGVFKDQIAWRFGTGESGQAGDVRSRPATSNRLCVATAAKSGSTERCRLNTVQLGSTYTGSPYGIANTGSTLAIGGYDTVRPTAKVCEVIVYTGASAGDDVAIGNSQQLRFGVS